MNIRKWKAYIRRDDNGDLEYYVGINWVWITLAVILVWVLV